MSGASRTAVSRTAVERGRDTARWPVLRSVTSDAIGATALLVLLIVIALSLLAPWIAPNDPNLVRIDMAGAPPGVEYLLGGDGAGRDILSRLLIAGGFTLLGAFIAVAVSVVIGVVTGLIAGYFGRSFDIAANTASEALMALPAMIVLLALFRTLGSSMYPAMIVFGVMLSPLFFRLVRGLVIGVKNELFVDAARVSGIGDARIIGRHILIAIREPVIVQIAIAGGIAIVMQSGLEFLGLGDPRIPTWGGMLQDAFDDISVSPLSVVWPGASIGITVASLALLGNAVRDGLQRVDDRNGLAGRAGLPIIPDTARADHAPTPAPAPALEDAILAVRGLRVDYGTGARTAEVVRGVDLDVRRGEVLGLVGESGSGKSQTAFAILGLLGPGGRIAGGSILFDGRELTAVTPAERRKLLGRRIAYVPQEPLSNLDPSFRVGFQLVEPLKAVLGLSADQAERRALELLAAVGLPEPRRVFDAYPHEISGGMAQRVLIAGAIACDPELLIADEVTAALDVTTQAEILDLLRELQKERSMGVILVTHDIGVVADLCDRVAVMQDGRIVETGDVIELFARPRHPYTRMLLEPELDDSPLRESAHHGEARR